MTWVRKPVLLYLQVKMVMESDKCRTEESMDLIRSKNFVVMLTGQTRRTGRTRERSETDISEVMQSLA